ncbi:hypothetical protein M427DRAFT_57584 [Gonapodya prolifera JEL478]|uniref:Uncharacterized protein n=1 Tax=Gonapodya prolifera (strain JEL478) TaxID=1344416 RepID=A0A139ACL3_GONPJ|nr:hypothetical protein M427DRAFT_57584 [Gonapodya prolifera JEL478]|eukprot:KXS14409.1 hypothetical protein M427DRAFT_57584 [Gonapodya prolifera JEL478]
MQNSFPSSCNHIIFSSPHSIRHLWTNKPLCRAPECRLTGRIIHGTSGPTSARFARRRFVEEKGIQPSSTRCQADPKKLPKTKPSRGRSESLASVVVAGSTAPPTIISGTSSISTSPARQWYGVPERTLIVRSQALIESSSLVRMNDIQEMRLGIGGWTVCLHDRFNEARRNLLWRSLPTRCWSIVCGCPLWGLLAEGCLDIRYATM